ncbi:MAG: rhodanese-like domain-containing protein [Blastocatellia bacterium]
MFATITVEELKAKQDAGESFRLIDVREPHEYQLCRLPDAELKPLGQIAQWMHELDAQEELILHCHHGMRSARACMLLAGQGFTNVKNLTGGIDAWSLSVDSSVPRY